MMRRAVCWHTDPIIKTWSIYQHLHRQAVYNIERRTVSVALFNAGTEQTHRYFLSRIWDCRRWPLVAIMCNPSTADAFKNDPTVALIESFARKRNFGGFIVLNVFAFRSTKPEGVVLTKEPIGRYNLTIIEHVLDELCWRSTAPPYVLLAWGELAGKLCKQTRLSAKASVVEILQRYDLKVGALALSKAGQPRHPLYLPTALTPVIFTKEQLRTL